MPSLRLHCPHTSTLSAFPALSLHPPSSLYFCDDCSALRCLLCLTPSAPAYYCPGCLFDFPSSAVVRERGDAFASGSSSSSSGTATGAAGEGNGACSRSCLACPNCSTLPLTVVPSDLPSSSGVDLLSAEASRGTPPYLLRCEACKWQSKAGDGKEGTYERSTGVVAQARKPTQEAAYFSTLLSHYASTLSPPRPPASGGGISSSSSARPSHTKARAAAAAALASSRLLADVPSLRNHKDFRRSDVLAKVGARERKGEEATQGFEWKGERRGEEEYEKRREGKVRESLQPLPVPLRAKLTHRCPQCTSILLKPEVKTSSRRFKLRSMASSTLPDIFLALAGGGAGAIGGGSAMGTARRSRLVTGGGGGGGGAASGFLAPGVMQATTTTNDEVLLAGRRYTYDVTFTNPLSDAMSVKVTLLMPPSSSSSARDARDEPSTSGVAAASTAPASPPRSSSTSSPPRLTSPRKSYLVSAPYDLSLSASSFLIGPKDDILGFEDASDALPSRLEAGEDDVEEEESKEKVRRIGNSTTVSLECKIGREFSGDVEFAMAVTISYKSSDDLEATDEPRASGAAAHEASEAASKTIEFQAHVKLGEVLPRAASSAAAAGSAVFGGEEGPASMQTLVAGTTASTLSRREELDRKRRSVFGAPSTGAASTGGSRMMATQLQAQSDAGKAATGQESVKEREDETAGESRPYRIAEE